jgi:hypothetical protein
VGSPPAHHLPSQARQGAAAVTTLGCGLINRSPSVIESEAPQTRDRAWPYTEPDSGPKDSPVGKRAARLCREAGRARRRRDAPTQRNDRLVPPRSRQRQRCPLTCGFGARGGIRTDDLPITSRMLGVDLDGFRRIEPAHVGWPVGLDGFRRIQKDRLDDQTWPSAQPSGRWSRVSLEAPSASGGRTPRWPGCDGSYS